MKRKNMIHKLLVALLVVTLFLAACSDSTATPADDSGAGAGTSAETAGDGAQDGDGGEAGTDGGPHPLYAMLGDTSLSGVFDPNNLGDRSGINKALPFEPADPGNIVIGWTEITQSDPWFASVGDAARARAAEYGYTLYFDVAEHDLQAQSAHIDSYIARGVDIIVVDPTDVLGVAEDIQRAVDAGIPVLGFGSEIYGAPVITTITGNTFENGFVNGQAVARHFDGDEQINLGIIIGVMGNSTAESRVNGMLSGIIYERAIIRGQEIPREDAIYAATMLFKDVVRSGKFDSEEWKMACLNWGEGNWTYEGGLDVAESILTSSQGQGLNLILAENDFQGAGAAIAVANYGLTDEVIIACPGNGMKAEIEMIREGTLFSTGSHDGWAFATAAIDMIHELANGNNTYDEHNLPMLTAFTPIAITAENFDEYWDDDPTNLYHKTYPLVIRDIPALKAAFDDGSYYNN